MPRALLSVSDKSNLVEFARGLSIIGWGLVASGGTASHLQGAGLEIVPVERLTGSGEMLGGRVKTLHPAIHAGILARSTDADLQELQAAGYAPIDLVVCNLYPFRQVANNPQTTLEEAVEHIDIGGVALLRAAAKSFQRVTVIVDPADYTAVLMELEKQAAVSLDTRRCLALKAFAHTRDYDTAIHAYLSGGKDSISTLGDSFVFSAYKSGDELRYGENPHQKAGFYANSAGIKPLGGELLAGKALSYNNILDADAAWRTVSAFDAGKEAAAVIVKHLTPCGVATGTSLETAFPAALASDPVSAFGGVIAVNRTVNSALVTALGSLFVEVIIAPDFADDALEALKSGRKSCRLIHMKSAPALPNLEFRSVLGGVLVQECDHGDPANTEWKVVTKRAPSQQETAALKFAWQVVGHVKSNSIVLARENATVGVGGGLPSRVDAVKIAVEKAGERVAGSVMASDAFFPFPDGIEEAARVGITAVIQPGGSIRDQQIIDAADAANIAMIFSGVRHFRH